MPRATKTPPAEPTGDDCLRTLDDKIDALTSAVERLANEMRVIRDIAAEMHECFEWAVQNDKFRCEPPHVTHLTSMPKDPTDAAFGAKINAVPPAELDRLRTATSASTAAPPTTPVHQNELF